MNNGGECSTLAETGSQGGKCRTMTGTGWRIVCPMADTVSRKTRSRMMAAVRQRNTGPEMWVRRMLYKLGYRYVLHVQALPGRPDLVFPRRRKVIFVHGCFWHGHDCRKGKLPKSNVEFWRTKIGRNKVRDGRVVGELEDAGWDVCVVWQCEMDDEESLRNRLVGFLERRTGVKPA